MAGGEAPDLDCIQVHVHGGHLKGRAPVGGLGVDLRPQAQKDLDALVLAPYSCLVERSAACEALAVHVRPLPDEGLHDARSPIVGSDTSSKDTLLPLGRLGRHSP